ncbi:14571_t:CDS:2 [Funneliformis geosporum]|nr:14571_t:CDS:2 [Funneliformis geosporum]
MKVKVKGWHGVAVWRWDVPNEEVCGICRVPFDGCCPTCKTPGDDCSLNGFKQKEVVGNVQWIVENGV